MKSYRLIILIVLVAMLQLGFLPAWRPFDIVPDLLLVVVIALTLLSSATDGLICAMFVGLLLDICSGTDFGLRLGFYMAVTFSVSLLYRTGLNFSSLVWRLSLAAFFSLLLNILLLLNLSLSGAVMSGGYIFTTLVKILLVEIILMALVSPIVGSLIVKKDGHMTIASRSTK